MIIIYIKTHNITGKKYFGKTNRELSKLKSYKGSGKHWVRHLKVHGNDVSTRIFAAFEEDEFYYNIIEKICLDFSESKKIVDSSIWLNIRPENGFDGAPKGHKHSKQTKEKLSKIKIGTLASEETKLLMSEQRKGKNHWMVKHNLSDEQKKEYTAHLLDIDRNGENNGMFGKEHTDKTKEKISKANTGSKRTDEQKQQLSNILKGKSHKLKEVECPYCCKIGKGPNMTRYHFENCKIKNKG